MERTDRGGWRSDGMGDSDKAYVNAVPFKGHVWWRRVLSHLSLHKWCRDGRDRRTATDRPGGSAAECMEDGVGGARRPTGWPPVRYKLLHVVGFTPHVMGAGVLHVMGTGVAQMVRMGRQESRVFDVQFRWRPNDAQMVFRLGMVRCTRMEPDCHSLLVFGSRLTLV